jgi:hypothetical protein
VDTGDDSRYSFSPQSTLLARPQSGPTDGVHLTDELISLSSRFLDLLLKLLRAGLKQALQAPLRQLAEIHDAGLLHGSAFFASYQIVAIASITSRYVST